MHLSAKACGTAFPIYSTSLYPSAVRGPVPAPPHASAPGPESPPGGVDSRKSRGGPAVKSLRGQMGLLAAILAAGPRAWFPELPCFYQSGNL